MTVHRIDWVMNKILYNLRFYRVEYTADSVPPSIILRRTCKDPSEFELVMFSSRSPTRSHHWSGKKDKGTQIGLAHSHALQVLRGMPHGQLLRNFRAENVNLGYCEVPCPSIRTLDNRIE